MSDLFFLFFYDLKLTFHTFFALTLCVCARVCVSPGETVSLVDVDISRRGGNSLHPPTPPPPPRRSLSLLGTLLLLLPFLLLLLICCCLFTLSVCVSRWVSGVKHIICLPVDDFGGPPQQQGPFKERGVGASMQSLPPRPLALNPSLSTIQHSLSLNGEANSCTHDL